ncbi:hypothetical protein E3U43_019690, partial [Larimichthys crocea]
GVEPIAEVADGDGEELELPQEVTKLIKKKQPSKKVKKDKKEVSKETSEASVKEEVGGAEEPVKVAKKEKKEPSKEKKEAKKDSSKEPKEEAKKESKKESSTSSSSSKEKKESSKEKDKDKEASSKETGEKKVSKKSSPQQQLNPQPCASLIPGRPQTTPPPTHASGCDVGPAHLAPSRGTGPRQSLPRLATKNKSPAVSSSPAASGPLSRIGRIQGRTSRNFPVLPNRPELHDFLSAMDTWKEDRRLKHTIHTEETEEEEEEAETLGGRGPKHLVPGWLKADDVWCSRSAPEQQTTASSEGLIP